MITTYQLRTVSMMSNVIGGFKQVEGGRYGTKSHGLTLPRQRLHMIGRHAQLVNFVHSNV